MEGLTIGSVIASALGSSALSLIYARRVRRLWELLPFARNYWQAKIWSYGGGPAGIVTACVRGDTGRRDLPEREVAAAAEVYHYLRSRNGNVFGDSPTDQPFYGWVNAINAPEILNRPLLVITGGPVNNGVAALFLTEFHRQYPSFPLSAKLYRVGDETYPVPLDRVDYGGIGENRERRDLVPPSELEQFLEMALPGAAARRWEPGQRKGPDAAPRPDRFDRSLVLRCRMPATASKQVVIYAAGSSAASTYGAVRALLTPKECEKLARRASANGVGAVVETHVVGHYAQWSRVVDDSVCPV